MQVQRCPKTPDRPMNKRAGAQIADESDEIYPAIR